MLSGYEITRLYLMTHKHVALIKQSGSLGLCKHTTRAGFDSRQPLICVYVCICKSVFLPQFIKSVSVSQLLCCIIKVEMCIADFDVTGSPPFP